MSKQLLVQASNLKKYFPVQKGFFSRVRATAKAVDGINLEIYDGETLALVGESGCGKSTTARMLMGLLPPTSGTITFDGKDIFSRERKQKELVAREMQMIFQDVYASLNPRKTLRQILSQPFFIHTKHSRGEVDKKINELLEIVELAPAERYLDRFPHELSGGQKQRVAIARAIALHPRLIVADEPVSGLDMSVKASILELMRRLQRDLQQSYLLVTHDLAIVRSVASRVAVMYLGKKVEEATTAVLFEAPLHPYTRILLSATPIPDPRLARKRTRIPIAGEVPSATNPPSGCRFHPRCPLVEKRCKQEEPPLREVEPGRFVACHVV